MMYFGTNKYLAANLGKELESAKVHVSIVVFIVASLHRLQVATVCILATVCYESIAIFPCAAPSKEETVLCLFLVCKKLQRES